MSDTIIFLFQSSLVLGHNWWEDFYLMDSKMNQIKLSGF